MKWQPSVLIKRLPLFEHEGRHFSWAPFLIISGWIIKKTAGKKNKLNFTALWLHKAACNRFLVSGNENVPHPLKNSNSHTLFPEFEFPWGEWKFNNNREAGKAAEAWCKHSEKGSRPHRKSGRDDGKSELELRAVSRPSRTSTNIFSQSNIFCRMLSLLLSEQPSYKYIGIISRYQHSWAGTHLYLLNSWLVSMLYREYPYARFYWRGSQYRQRVIGNFNLYFKAKDFVALWRHL